MPVAEETPLAGKDEKTLEFGETNMKNLAKKIMQWFRSREEGFTLAELLVVVAIVVGLAAVILPNVGKFTGKGKEGALATELSSVQTAIDAWSSSDTANVPVPLPTGYTDDFSATSATANGVDLLTGAFLRLPNGATTTQGVYCWDANGTVTQADPSLGVVSVGDPCP